MLRIFVLSLLRRIRLNIMKYPFALLLVIPLALACTRMEYDTSDGVNHELTLFERQLTVPVDITVSNPISKSVAATSS